MKNVQKLFEERKPVIDLPPGEYQGPFTIDHSCTVNGNGATLWGASGPVLTLRAPGITLKNLRIELTKAPPDTVALEVQGKNAAFVSLEVYGDVRGEGIENPHWEFPRIIDLGTFAAKTRNDYIMTLRVSGDYRIRNDLRDVLITPEKLTAGENKVAFQIMELADSAILYGDFLLETENGILRRIFLTGRASKDGEKQQGKKLSFPSRSGSPAESLPTARKSSVELARKGQRMAAPTGDLFRVVYSDSGRIGTMEIDAYAFALGEGGKVRGDEDFIFFGHPVGKGIRLDTEGDALAVALSPKEIPADIQRVSVCFSIYEDENYRLNNFSKVKEPMVTVYVDGTPLYEFLPDLANERTFTALEFYRHKGQWKMSFIGAGYIAGLRKLCESYGLTVV